MDVPPVDYEQCSADEREVVLGELLRHRNALLDEVFRVILAADRLHDHEVDGAHSTVDWLAYRCNVSGQTARQWLKAAKALESLPGIRERFVIGDLSFEQLRHALTFATPETDASLAKLLPSLSCSEIEMMAKQRRKIDQRDHDEARRHSHLHLRRDRSGLGSRLSGFLPNEDAAIVEAAINRRAESAGPDAETGIWAPHDQRAAGALRDLCAKDLGRSGRDGSEPDSAMVVIHAPADLLHEGDTGNATINGEPIPHDALRRFLCDARIEVHFDDPDGRTVGVGRATRHPPRWLRRRALGRDHGECRWPGCRRGLRHLHHMVHWPDGGPTDSSNLMGVCWHHHHLLHEGGWSASGDADGEIVLTGPTGRTIRSRAGPLAA